MIQDKIKVAKEFWLSGISFENDFKPNSDQATSDYMKHIGHKISKTGIYKWRIKYNWQKDLEFKIKQLTSEDETVKASLGGLVKDEAVQKTIVDLERNKALLGQAYEILELKSKLIMEQYRITGKITNDDTKVAISILQLTANREDRMLDRKVVSETLGREDALRAIAAVAAGVAFDGEGEFEDDAIEQGEIIDVKIEEDDDEWD